MKEKHHEIIIKNIDALLREKNISISKLEKSLGISNGYISRLRNGKYSFSLALLLKLAKKFKISIDYLLTDFDATTSDEYDLINFLEFIYQSSISNHLLWAKVSIEEINNNLPDSLEGPILTNLDSIPEHYAEMYPPKIVKALDPYVYNPDKTFFGKTFLGELSIGSGKKINSYLYTDEILTDDYYYTEITDNIFSFKLFLYKVQYITESPEHNISNVIEAYIETSKDSYYLCNSIEYGDYISSKLVELYKLAKSQNASIKLDLNLKKLIQKFNNSK